MRVLQRYLAVALLLSVLGAVWLTLRSVPLPDVARVDRTIKENHQADPGNIRDVCLVWGDDVTNGSYRKVAFWSGEFTCSYSWSGVLTPAFNRDEISNNHLIPASGAIARQIGDIHGREVFRRPLAE